MTALTVAANQCRAAGRFQRKVEKTGVRRLLLQDPQPSNSVSKRVLDIGHRADIATGTLQGTGHFSAKRDNVHSEKPSLQVTQPYQQTVEGACMKNGNKLQTCLQIRDELVLALRRDLIRFRSGVRMLAEICGKSERTAANWLSGATRMGADDLLKAAESDHLPTLKAMVLKRISPPDEYTLAQELTMLRARLARAEARYREEFNDEVHEGDRLDVQMDAGNSQLAGEMARRQIGSLGAHSQALTEEKREGMK